MRIAAIPSCFIHHLLYEIYSIQRKNRSLNIREVWIFAVEISSFLGSYIVYRFQKRPWESVILIYDLMCTPRGVILWYLKYPKNQITIRFIYIYTRLLYSMYMCIYLYIHTHSTHTYTHIHKPTISYLPCKTPIGAVWTFLAAGEVKDLLQRSIIQQLQWEGQMVDRS